jgi:hypothetical protein
MIGLPELIVIFAVAAPVVAVVFYLISLQKALGACSLQTRTLAPGLVWLLLIPLFNLIWHFIVVFAIAKSLHGEFVARNIDQDPAPGRNLGLALSILFVMASVPHPYFRAPFGILALICWIIYWVKVFGYSAKLQALKSTQGMV